MGISVSIVAATDEEMREFRADARKLEDMLSRTIPYSGDDRCYLADHWDALHYLLTGGPQGDAPPLDAIKRGEIEFRGEDRTHGVSSAATKALAAALERISEAALNERFDPKEMREKSVYPGRFWVFPGLANQIFEETMGYFGGLRDFAAKAAEAGKGLIFCRYEDW